MFDSHTNSRPTTSNHHADHCVSLVHHLHPKMSKVRGGQKTTSQIIDNPIDLCLTNRSPKGLATGHGGPDEFACSRYVGLLGGHSMIGRMIWCIKREKLTRWSMSLQLDVDFSHFLGCPTFESHPFLSENSSFSHKNHTSSSIVQLKCTK